MIRFSVFIFFLVFSNAAFAQDILSWEKCLELAKENNANLRSALAEEQSAFYQRNASLADFLPTATATLNSGRSGGSDSSTDEDHSGSIALKQNLFSGFSDIGEFNQAKADYMVFKANVEQVKANISYDIKSGFANFIFAKDTVELLDNIIKRRQSNLDIIKLRFKSGIENKGSLLLAEAYLDQAKYDRMQGENLLKSARTELCKAIGLSECGEFDIAKGSIPIKEPEKSDELKFIQIIQTTPSHLRVLAEQKAAEAGITIARSGFFPIVDFNASTGQSGRSFFPKNEEYWAVGLNLSFPFFSGGRDYYGIKSAKSKVVAAKENVKDVDRQLLIDLRQSYNGYIESVTKLKVDEGFKKAAVMRADIAKKKYNNGLLTFEDWDVIETDLINREKSYLQSKRDRIVREAAWELAQGKGVFSY